MSVLDIIDSLIEEQRVVVTETSPLIGINTLSTVSDQLNKRNKPKPQTKTVVIYPTEADKQKNYEAFVAGQKALATMKKTETN